MTEEQLNDQIAEACKHAVLELRETLKPTFNAKEMGYDDADHARLTITRMVDKKINKLSAEILKLGNAKT